MTIDVIYETWKGTIGPGALLRHLIQEERMAKTATSAAIPTIPIPADVAEFLKTGTWTEAGFTMPITKDRGLYQRTAKILETLGGKWNRKAQAIVFEDQPDAEVSLHEAIESGTYVDLRKFYQFFETPPAVSSLLMERLELRGKQTVLEPNAGHGALICAIAEFCYDTKHDPQVTAVEVNPDCEYRLRELIGSDSQVLKRLVMGDFLNIDPVDGLGYFDRIVMNPPFAKNQDIMHVQHAYKFLAPEGVLVAVMSPGFTFRSDKKASGFREWLEDIRDTGHAKQASYTTLPPNSFTVSGTNVNTTRLVIKKGK